MGAVELAGAVADPEQVRRAGVPVTGDRVASGQGLLEVEDQRLVARPDVHLVEGRQRARVDAARSHEPECALDVVCQDGVPLSLERRGGDELVIPGMHAREVGKPALREGAEQVERRRRLVIGRQETLRVGPASLGRGLLAVHQMSPERRDLLPVDELVGRGPGLGELPGDPAQLDDGQARPVHQDDGHLQEDLQAIADGGGPEVVERLGAIACLQQERPAGGHPGKCSLQFAGLTGEDEGRERREEPADVRKRGVIRPLGLLRGGVRAPARRGPLGDGHEHER